MSTTTNFKRIALVAVAALGLGVLSSVPSNAATTALSVTVANGTATTAISDSTTAGSVAVSFLSNEATDSVTVKVSLDSRPSTLTTVQPTLLMVDTASIFSVVDTDTAGTNTGETITSTLTVRPNYKVAADVDAGIRRMDTGSATSRTLGASFKVFMDTTTANDLVAGTYVNKVTVTPYSKGAAGTAVTYSVSIVVSTALNLSAVASSATSTAIIHQGATFVADSAVDSASVSAPATAADTVRAVIRIALKNSAGGNAAESITVTTDRGFIADADNATVRGKSLIVVDDEATEDINIYSDGTSGKATITISTPSVTFAAKTVTFYSTTPASAVAVLNSKVIGSSAAVAVVGKELDAAGNSLGASTDLYAYSSDTSVINANGTACTWVASLGVATCSLTGLKNGKATITLRDADTRALSTIASNGVEVTVNLNAAASVSLTLDKASYLPNEKATLTIKVLDKDGALLPAGTFANLFATGGITTSSSLGNLLPNNPALSAVSITTAVNSTASVDTPVVTTDAIAQRTFFMPASGNITFSATGGTSLPTAGQVAVTAKASVTDTAGQALAAVTALATTVASLRTLIVTLTNLVLKIQKKVKA